MTQHYKCYRSSHWRPKSPMFCVMVGSSGIKSTMTFPKHQNETKLCSNYGPKLPHAFVLTCAFHSDSHFSFFSLFFLRKWTKLHCSAWYDILQYIFLIQEQLLQCIVLPKWMRPFKTLLQNFLFIFSATKSMQISWS